MKRYIYLCTVAILLLSNPVLASNKQTQSGTHTSKDAKSSFQLDNAQNNNAETSQTNTGSVQNVGILNQTIGEYNFGPGISCSTPSVALNGYMSSLSREREVYGATFSLMIPLGGKVGGNCRRLTDEIVKQRRLDTSLTLVKTCVDFSSRGVRIDPKIHPELAAACIGVSAPAAKLE
ncbi:hypothetical protein ABN584_04050 [Gloeocapsa sp. BRSZ]